MTRAPQTRSLSTAVTVGLAALALVIAGTTGAVAGRLVTSSDIEDGTIQTRDIAEGAVGWARVSEGMQERIGRLAGKDGKDGKDGVTGATGPAGAQGEQGPGGAQGPRGRTGPAGAALVGYDIYITEETPDDFGAELVPAFGEGIELPEGSYLVTLNGVTEFPGAMYAGALEGIGELAILQACFSSALLPIFGYACKTTYPLRVGAGGAPLELPVISLSIDDDPAPNAFAEVAVYSTQGELPDLDACRCRPSDRDLSRALRQFQRRLSGR